MTDRIETRLFVADSLVSGATIKLSASQLHHLRHVLRLAPGALLSLFNGRDGAWLARLVALGKTAGQVELLRQLEPQRPEPDLWLLFSPLKRHRLDFLVEKVTELGIARLLPVLTERSVVRRVNEASLREAAREAAEQCERLSVPEVAALQSLGQALDGWPPARRLYICAESGRAQPLTEALRAGPAAFVTGPEGGFSQRELDAVLSLPFVTPVGLGPRILRAETAAMAAVASWQTLCGDASRRPPDDRAVAGRATTGSQEE